MGHSAQEVGKRRAKPRELGSKASDILTKQVTRFRYRLGDAPPKGFESKQDRRAREEAQRERDRQAAEETQRRRAEERRRVEEAEAVDAYLAGLTPEKRAGLEAEAFAHAPEDVRRNLESPELALLRGSLQKMALRTYVAEKIRQENPTPA
jgi:hypothetical protein